MALQYSLDFYVDRYLLYRISYIKKEATNRRQVSGPTSSFYVCFLFPGFFFASHRRKEYRSTGPLPTPVNWPATVYVAPYKQYVKEICTIKSPEDLTNVDLK